MIQLAINMDESRFSRHLATGVPTELRAGREPVRNPKNTIPAVNRTLDLVRILAEGEAETNTKALALRLGMPLTTCYRVLCSLIGRGQLQWLSVFRGQPVVSISQLSGQCGSGHAVAVFEGFLLPRLFGLCAQCGSDQSHQPFQPHLL